jgi:hypothetical protein
VADIVGSIVILLVAIIIIYIGFEVIYAINPLLAILFVALALYVVFRSISGGGSGRSSRRR